MTQNAKNGNRKKNVFFFKLRAQMQSYLSQMQLGAFFQTLLKIFNFCGSYKPKKKCGSYFVHI